MRVSEIRVNQIRVNQGLGVFPYMLCNIRTLKTPCVSDNLALFFYFIHFSTPTFSRDTNKTYF